MLHCDTLRYTVTLMTRPVFRGGLRGLKPPRKVYTKISGYTKLWFSWFLLELRWCHEHPNGSYRPSWSKTCFRMHQNAQFWRRKCQNFSGEGAQPPPPDLTPTGERDTPILAPPPSTPSAPTFECLRHSTLQTTFLDTGLLMTNLLTLKCPPKDITVYM